MKNVKWLSNLKLRYAYGTVGNQAIDPYATLAGLGSYGYQFAEVEKGVEFGNNPHQ